ncbi:hypothetical protein [Haloferula helveola]
MKRNAIIAAGAAVLLIGVVAIAMNSGNSGDTDDSGGSTTENIPPRGTTGGSDGEFQPDMPPKASARSAREEAQSELVDQYGESRTKLARHVSENVVGLLDDVIAMGEMMVEGRSGDFGGGRGGVRWALRGTGVELNEEQEEQAAELMKDFRKRELEKTKSSVNDLRKDPTALMGMLLAGDARSRDELSEADYAALQEANADALGDIINPLDRNNFRGGSPMEDELFRSGFEALLDEEQAAAFAESQAKKEEEAASEEPSRTDITQLPVMDLEAADEAIRSTRQMTAGFKQVVEGMGNLGPLLEQQRRNRGEEEAE